MSVADYMHTELVELRATVAEQKKKINRLKRALIEARGKESMPSKKRRLAPPPTSSSTVESQTDLLTIHSDGSALKNGKQGARAGYGVVVSDGRELSGKVSGKQTNQRAELTAMYHALVAAGEHKNVLIKTDSEYAMKGTEIWHKRWLVNDWKTAKGGAVENKDLWLTTIEIYKQRQQKGYVTRMEWVKGHSGDAGNDQADKLAKQAALAK